MEILFTTLGKKGDLSFIDRKVIFGIVIALLVGVSAGLALAPYVSRYTAAPSVAMYSNDYIAGFSAGSDDARKRLEKGALAQEADTRHVNGGVTSVQGDHILLHLQTLGNPFDEMEALDRVITITPTTKIVKITQSGPSAFTREDGLLKDIRVGNELLVTASEDIKRKSEFTADVVYIRIPLK